ncbi:MAG: arsenate reductase [Caulobacterales bacterium]|nr:arsenate reductase [Caulobacterales bacterium]
MTLALYGLKTCDTCRKAIKELEAAGRPVTVVDMRAEADLAALAPRWLDAVGVDALVNRRSTTWRSLSEAERARSADAAGAAALLAAHPTLVKRPVIVSGDGVHVGWTAAVRAALGL